MHNMYNVIIRIKITNTLKILLYIAKNPKIKYFMNTENNQLHRMCND